MAGGMNRFKRLQAAGVDTKEDRQTIKLTLKDITIPTEGPLAHPRLHKPVSQELIDHIAEHGILKPITVREEPGKGGKPKFILLDGSRRVRGGLAAEKLLKKQGKLAEDGSLYVKVEFFEGSDVDFLFARQEDDADPLKLPHTPGEIAATFIQIRSLQEDVEIEALLKVCPKNKGYTPRVVEALLRWKSLPKPVADAFDNGIEIGDQIVEAPVGLLPALLDKFAKDEMMGALKELVEGGYKTYSGATKFKNAKDFEAQVNGSDDPDVEVEDEGDEIEDEREDENEVHDEEAEETGETGEGEEGDRPAKTRGPRETTPTAMVRKSWVKKVANYFTEVKPSAEALWFARGAMLDVGLDIDVDGATDKLLALVEGIRWRRGYKVKLPQEIKDGLSHEPAPPQASAKRTGKGKGKSKGKGKGKGKAASA